MIVPVMAISNLVLTRQIYSEETNGAHAHYREPVPLKFGRGKHEYNLLSWIDLRLTSSSYINVTNSYCKGNIAYGKIHKNEGPSV